jgi:hypothetical protein
MRRLFSQPTASQRWTSRLLAMGAVSTLAYILAAAGVCLNAFIAIWGNQ